MQQTLVSLCLHGGINCFLSVATPITVYMYFLGLQGTTGRVQPRSEKVNSRHLTLIKWSDEQGQTQRFYLIEKIAYKWRTLGEILGFDFSKLETLATDHQNNSEECCRAVLGEWLGNPPPDYPTTWQGLLELLKDGKLGEVVSQLKSALDQAQLH